VSIATRKKKEETGKFKQHFKKKKENLENGSSAQVWGKNGSALSPVAKKEKKLTIATMGFGEATGGVPVS